MEKHLSKSLLLHSRRRKNRKRSRGKRKKNPATAKIRLLLRTLLSRTPRLIVKTLNPPQLLPLHRQLLPQHRQQSLHLLKPQSCFPNRKTRNLPKRPLQKRQKRKKILRMSWRRLKNRRNLRANQRPPRKEKLWKSQWRQPRERKRRLDSKPSKYKRLRKKKKRHWRSWKSKSMIRKAFPIFLEAPLGVPTQSLTKQAHQTQVLHRTLLSHQRTKRRSRYAANTSTTRALPHLMN